MRRQTAVWMGLIGGPARYPSPHPSTMVESRFAGHHVRTQIGHPPRMPIDDLDTYRLAKTLIDRHVNAAADDADARAERLAVEGDADGGSWRRSGNCSAWSRAGQCWPRCARIAYAAQQVAA